jgi:hypothetical protein
MSLTPLFPGFCRNHLTIASYNAINPPVPRKKDTTTRVVPRKMMQQLLYVFPITTDYNCYLRNNDQQFSLA